MEDPVVNFKRELESQGAYDDLPRKRLATDYHNVQNTDLGPASDPKEKWGVLMKRVLIFMLNKYKANRSSLKKWDLVRAELCPLTEQDVLLGEIIQNDYATASFGAFSPLRMFSDSSLYFMPPVPEGEESVGVSVDVNDSGIARASSVIDMMNMPAPEVAPLPVTNPMGGNTLNTQVMSLTNPIPSSSPITYPQIERPLSPLQPLPPSTRPSQRPPPKPKPVTPLPVRPKKTGKESTKQHTKALPQVIEMGRNDKNLKRYGCSSCPYTSVRKADVRKHLATHSKERPFPCRIQNVNCNKRFRDSSTRTRHEKIHFKKVFKCEICCAEYLQESNYQKHKEQKHAGTANSGLNLDDLLDYDEERFQKNLEEPDNFHGIVQHPRFRAFAPNVYNQVSGLPIDVYRHESASLLRPEPYNDASKFELPDPL
eukprot:m.225182 g.225182  ORF g.225182 m.225182 type:complete len:426 (-) comp15953_c1_seq1:158-1435(-)